MPIEFLTDEQRRSHGRFNAEPTPDQLARYFHLDDADRTLIDTHRGDHNRLGFAVQLCTARFLGTFLEKLAETPKGVIAFVGQQLGIRDLTAFTEYCDARTRKAHVMEIRRRYGFCDFSARSGRFRLNRWLYALCWTQHRSARGAFRSGRGLADYP
jgi:TnpA family transposase